MQKDIFIQARMSSTRMPGKVLFDIQNIPILVRTINRIRRCKIADNIVVITSTNEKDSEIEKICNKFSIPIYRGSESDLFIAMKQISLTGKGPAKQIPSAGCGIKWKNN